MSQQFRNPVDVLCFVVCFYCKRMTQAVEGSFVATRQMVQASIDKYFFKHLTQSPINMFALLTEGVYIMLYVHYK